jgi:hypothetical protein
MELRLTDAVAFVVLDKSELTADTELITSTYIPGGRNGVHAHPGIRVREPGT